MDIDKKHILEQINDGVLEKIQHYQKYKQVKLDQSEINKIKEIYEKIVTDRSLNFNSSCGSCVKEAMKIILSFYEREIKKVDKEIVDLVIPTELIDKEDVDNSNDATNGKDINEVDLKVSVPKNDDIPIKKVPTKKGRPKKK